MMELKYDPMEEMVRQIKEEIDDPAGACNEGISLITNYIKDYPDIPWFVKAGLNTALIVYISMEKEFRNMGTA